MKAFAARARGQVRTGWQVARVERDGQGQGGGWRVHSAAGDEIRCDVLVSTLPIHELLKVWPAAPQEARDAAARLRYNSLINVVIGSAQKRSHSLTAVYVPDPEVIFHRVSFPHNFSERCAPADSEIAMAEITVNEGDGVWELGDEALLQRTTADLARIGFVDPARISYRRVVRFRYGYPVYDLGYRQNVTTLRDSVEGAGVRLLGAVRAVRLHQLRRVHRTRPGAGTAAPAGRGSRSPTAIATT